MASPFLSVVPLARNMELRFREADITLTAGLKSSSHLFFILLAMVLH